MNNTNFYIGEISGFPNGDTVDESHQVLVDIPGLVEKALAFPKSAEMDEPKKGDPVLVLSLDPIYNTYFIYEKLKENDFIGFRSSGKMISITPDYIKLAVYDPEANKKDNKEPSRESMKALITVDNKGNIEVETSGNVGIYGKDGKAASLTIGNQLKPGVPVYDPEKNIPLSNPFHGPFIAGCNPVCPYSSGFMTSNELMDIGGKL